MLLILYAMGVVIEVYIQDINPLKELLLNETHRRAAVGHLESLNGILTSPPTHTQISQLLALRAIWLIAFFNSFMNVKIGFMCCRVTNVIYCMTTRLTLAVRVKFTDRIREYIYILR